MSVLCVHEYSTLFCTSRLNACIVRGGVGYWDHGTKTKDTQKEMLKLMITEVVMKRNLKIWNIFIQFDWCHKKQNILSLQHAHSWETPKVHINVEDNYLTRAIIIMFVHTIIFPLDIIVLPYWHNIQAYLYSARWYKTESFITIIYCTNTK